jgi:transcription initiation factor TFIIE subunit alpha
MQRALLEHIVVSIVGKPGIQLVDLLHGKKNVNEFLIAKKLGLTINQTRNLLYRLSDSGLVSSTRKKDRKKGWFTYFWTLEIEKSFILLQQILMQKIHQLRKEIEVRAKARFYICETCHVEYTEEDALQKDFICPECGSVLALKDNTRAIADMQRQIQKLESDLKIVQSKVAEEQELSAKKRARAEKREKAAKAKVRAEKRAAMLKARKELMKSKKKKIAKKPIPKRKNIKKQKRKSKKKKRR